MSTSSTPEQSRALRLAGRALFIVLVFGITTFGLSVALLSMRPTHPTRLLLTGGRRTPTLPGEEMGTAAAAATSSKAGNAANETTAGTTTQVRINGQPIPVPANGTIHKTVTNNETTTTVDVSASGGDTNNLSVESTSTSQSDGDAQR